MQNRVSRRIIDFGYDPVLFIQCAMFSSGIRPYIAYQRSGFKPSWGRRYSALVSSIKSCRFIFTVDGVDRFIPDTKSVQTKLKWSLTLKSLNVLLLLILWSLYFPNDINLNIRLLFVVCLYKFRFRTRLHILLKANTNSLSHTFTIDIRGRIAKVSLLQ